MEKYILRLGHNDRDFEEMIEKQGTVYKIKDKRTIDIHITTEETTLTPDAMALWHSDGTAKGTTVPAGTMVMNNNIVVNQDFVDKNLEPVLDENGNQIEGKYHRIRLVKAMPNPFGVPISKVSQNGYEIDTYPKDCFVVYNSVYRELTFPSKEEFEENYVIHNQNNAKKI